MNAMIPATMHIPDDIYHEIGRFIPSAKLQDLLEVNSPFYNLAMDSKYHTATLHVFNRGTAKRIRHLQLPQVHTRVRTLDIEALFLLGSDAPTTSREEAIELITSTISSLTAVNSLSLGLSGHYLHHKEVPKDILRTMWNTFGRSLRTAHVAAPLDVLVEVLGEMQNMSVLQDLSLTILDSGERGVEDESCPDDPDRLRDLARLVNGINERCTLQRFRFVLPSAGDVGPFFVALDNGWGSLRGVELSVGLDMEGAVHPITHFLSTWRLTIKDVKFFGTALPGLVPWTSAINETPSGDHGALSGLRSFEIDGVPKGNRAATLTTLSRCLQRSPTLTTLTLMAEALQLTEVSTILLNTPALTILRLNCHVLNPQLVDLLARSVTMLEELFLGVSYILPAGERPSYQPDPIEQATRFAAEMHAQRRLFPDWKVRELGMKSLRLGGQIASPPEVARRIPPWSHRPRQTLGNAHIFTAMHTLADVVPSIFSFYGTGSKNL